LEIGIEDDSLDQSIKNDQARPEMPEYPIRIITRYLNKKADLVVDLGCGSGL